MPISPQSAALFISQSGETADTLASLRYCRKAGMPIGAIVNVRESTIARESDVTLADAGRPGDRRRLDQGLHLPAFGAGRRSPSRAGAQRGTISADEEKALVRSLSEAPRYASQVLKLDSQIEKVARELAHYRHVLYLGRDTNYPLAMEGALKLKEISYIHAEGYAAGELKHGPIALIDENMPVIVIAPHDRIFEKTVSNMQEVAARGGKIILITDQKGAAARHGEDDGDDRAAGRAGDHRADHLRAADPAARLSHRGVHGHRRRPAAQPGEIGDGGIAPSRRERSLVSNSQSRACINVRACNADRCGDRMSDDSARSHVRHDPAQELFPDRLRRLRAAGDHRLHRLVLHPLGRFLGEALHPGRLQPRQLSAVRGAGLRPDRGALPDHADRLPHRQLRRPLDRLATASSCSTACRWCAASTGR